MASPVPGLPPLLSGFTITSPTLLLQDAFDALTGQDAPQWGIFQDGVAVIEADNVLSFEYKQEWSVSDYPVETGGFQSYDKVSRPFDAKLRFSCGGSEDARIEFLQSISDVASTTDLYDVVTPEQTYESANITHYDYRRTSTNGVGLLIIDIWLVEIREATSAEFSNTQAASGSGTQNDGTVQTTTPTNGQTQSILYGLENGG